jgi:multiple sugar transport system permease protein
MQNRYVSEQFYLRLFWGLGLVIFILIVIAPFYVMVMTSLKSQQSLLANPLDLSINMDVGVTVLFRSYIELFTEYNFGLLLMNSSLVSVSTVLITLLFSIPGAYAVAKLQFPGRNLLSGSVLLIYLIPAIILVIPLYAVFSQLGLRNSLIGLCMVYPATTIPVALYMFQGYFAGLPSELDDAGLMDGLTRWQIILKIAVPLSKPAIASVALYVFMIAWNEFLFAFMFLDDIKLFTLSRGIVSLNSSEVPREHLMAGAVIATIPVLLLFLWFEKFLVAGLTSGSVKG